MRDKIMVSLIDYLVDKYQCHSIILYGSYARGDNTAESDIDVICFCDSITAKNDTSFVNGVLLDAWIYNTEKMNNANGFLHIADGKILLDDQHKCHELMSEINKLLMEGPPQVPEEEKDFLKAWLKKMFVRSQKGDAEGSYRLHWLLKDSLEIYFSIIDTWYIGPKKSLQWLLENDKETYMLFEKALKPSSNSHDIDSLVSHICNK